MFDKELIITATVMYMQYILYENKDENILKVFMVYFKTFQK